MITRLRSAVLCDDIRTEDNGKALFIGVYGKAVLSAQVPGMLQVVAAMAFDTDSDVTPIEFRVSALSSRVASMTLEGIDGFTTLAIPLQLALTEPRTLTVEYRNPDAEWQLAATWNLGFAEDAQPAAPDLAERIYELAERLKADQAS